MDSTATPILVLGATGKTGRRLVDRLRSTGRRVRAASRTGDVHFDWDDIATWVPAVSGVHAVYIVPPTLRLGGVAERVGEFAGLAARRGVERLVLLSARGVDQARADNDLLLSEQAVEASGPPWTILRPSWFAQNFSEDWFLPGVRAGTLALPAGDGAEPFVDVDDIADVATAALVGAGSGRHDGQVYELSGPRALTFAEAVGHIGRATGRAIGYRRVTIDDFVAERTAAGIPSDYAHLLAELLGVIANGWDSEVSDGVERALGRTPRSFEDYVTRAAGQGAWD